MHYDAIYNRLRSHPALEKNSITDIEELARMIHGMCDDSYAQGMGMARKLLRLRLGLGTPEDEVVTDFAKVMSGDLSAFKKEPK